MNKTDLQDLNYFFNQITHLSDHKRVKFFLLLLFLRKLFHCKTSLQLRNVRCLNSVKMLDFGQFDQSSIFMLKTMICREVEIINFSQPSLPIENSISF